MIQIVPRANVKAIKLVALKGFTRIPYNVHFNLVLPMHKNSQGGQHNLCLICDQVELSEAMTGMMLFALETQSPITPILYQVHFNQPLWPNG